MTVARRRAAPSGSPSPNWRSRLQPHRRPHAGGGHQVLGAARSARRWPGEGPRRRRGRRCGWSARGRPPRPGGEGDRLAGASAGRPSRRQRRPARGAGGLLMPLRVPSGRFRAVKEKGLPPGAARRSGAPGAAGRRRPSRPGSGARRGRSSSKRRVRPVTSLALAVRGRWVAASSIRPSCHRPLLDLGHAGGMGQDDLEAPVGLGPPVAGLGVERPACRRAPRCAGGRPGTACPTSVKVISSP